MERLNKKEKELKEKAEVKHITNKALKYYIKDVEDSGGKERAIINRLKKEDRKIHEYINQKEVEHVTIDIEWKKNNIWGMNPHATAFVYYKNGDFETLTATCGGFGYDKASTVIAEIYNNIFKYKLYKIQKNATKKKIAPYGVCFNDFMPYFGGGIGTSCFYSITKYMGEKFKDIAHTKHTDIYSVTMK